ncbi:MAG: hypothetical protein QXU67_01305, partial [Candidatus Bathyarchaeia archaeon]
MKERELLKIKNAELPIVISILIGIPLIFFILLYMTLYVDNFNIDFEIVYVELKVLEKPRGEKSCIIVVSIWNTGAVDISSLKIECPDISLDKELLEQGETLNKGERINFVITEGFSEFKVGTP